MDLIVTNYADECDMLVINAGAAEIVVSRGEDGRVFIDLKDTKKNTKKTYILGEVNEDND